MRDGREVAQSREKEEEEKAREGEKEEEVKPLVSCLVARDWQRNGPLLSFFFPSRHNVIVSDFYGCVSDVQDSHVQAVLKFSPVCFVFQSARFECTMSSAPSGTLAYVLRTYP